MAVISPYVSITTLHVNELRSPIKRHRVVGWIKNKRPNYMLFSGDSSQLEKQNINSM